MLAHIQDELKVDCVNGKQLLIEYFKIETGTLQPYSNNGQEKFLSFSGTH